MTKKLIFAGVLTIGLTTLALLAQTVSADYYDCNGNIRSGDPRPSECHYYLSPRTNSSTINHRERTHDVGATSGSSTSRHRERTHVVGATSGSSTSRHRENVITEIGRNYSDLEKARNGQNAIIENDPDNYSKKYEVRNARKYCVGDYCYIIYDYCYDLSHCEEKVQRIPRDNYGYGNDWQDELHKYLDEYFSKFGQGDCNQYNQNQGRCIYRGFHFGGFHNGYWYN